MIRYHKIRRPFHPCHGMSSLLTNCEIKAIFYRNHFKKANNDVEERVQMIVLSILSNHETNSSLYIANSKPQ